MDPTLKNKTITALKQAIPELSPRLKAVAKYIVDHPSDFGLDPIRETARKCEVSTYTLVRMAERMGFEGYDEMREPFRHALVSTTAFVEHPDWIDSLREQGDLGRLQAEAATNTMAIVQRSLEHQTPEQMERVADMLLGARNVYLTAVRASYAMAYYFHYVGRMALPSLQLIPRHMNSPIDELNYAAMLNDAVYVQQTTGERQKAVLAVYNPTPKIFPPEVLKERGFHDIRILTPEDEELLRSKFDQA